MSKKWEILLVDDEEDVHSVTSLILKQKKWRGQRFKLTSAHSRAEAIEILKKKSDFHVAVIDVVMDGDTAGLELCEYIREHCATSLRIVLRTGQPGLAPEQRILNEYDIDYYLSKGDATPEKLYSIIRACLRSSQDISTLLAYGKQLQSFTRTLQQVSSVSDLLTFMGEALAFLELKHNASCEFNYDIADIEASFIDVDDSSGMDRAAIGAAITDAHSRQLPMLDVLAGTEIGLAENDSVILFESSEEGDQAGSNTARGALVFRLEHQEFLDKAKRDFLADARLFIDNWCIAFSTVRLKERLGKEQMLREKMYFERMEGIASMVTGVAHELNTPLGVAQTATSMVTELTDQILSGELTDPEDIEESRDDLKDACDLLTRNVDRAQKLIKSFKGLSASQLSDERSTVSLVEVIDDCLESMRPELQKRNIKPALVLPDSELDFTWEGFSGHLSQVIVNLIQNTIRYAYEDGDDGRIDVHVRRPNGGQAFEIEYVDYGKGVDPEILPRLFDAFVTSGRGKGGSGLGMAISQNIVVNLLGGSIGCSSTPGEGAKFTIKVPTVVNTENRDFSMNFTTAGGVS